MMRRFISKLTHKLVILTLALLIAVFATSVIERKFNVTTKLSKVGGEVAGVIIQNTPPDKFLGVTLAGATATAPYQDVQGDVAITGQTKLISGNASGALRIGADVNATTLSNNVRKIGRVTIPTYTDATVNSFLLAGDNDATHNGVYFGGYPAASIYAATDIHFFTAADTTTTGGTERLTINNAGNVGIGTINPALKLAVYGTTGYPATSGTVQTGIARLEAANNNIIDFGQANSSPWGAWIQSTDRSNLASNFPLLLNPNGGNVGIGITNPLAKLVVAGNIRTGLTSDSYNYYLETAARVVGSGDVDWDFNTHNVASNKTIMSFDTSTGNVGIGTAAPSSLLQLNPPAGVEGLRVISSTYSPLAIRNTANTSDLFRVDQTGKVSIGIPTYTGSWATEIGYSTAGATVLGVTNIDAGVGSYAENVVRNENIGTGGLDAAMRMMAMGTGYTTVGGFVQDAGILSSGPGLGGGLSIMTRANSAIRFYTGGYLDANERMRIQADGKVGIGIAAPTYQLQLSTDSAGKPNGGSWANSSDSRLKKNVKPITNALEKIIQLNGVNFEWINPEEHGNMIGAQGGFIAQDIKRIFPGWISEIDPSGKDKGLVPAGGKIESLSLPFEYDALMVEAIKEQQAEIKQLQENNAALDLRLQALEAKIH